MCGCLKAQDTLWQRAVPLDNYFYNNWIDTNTDMYSMCEYYYNGSLAMAKRFITEDTLQVYGIAAMMVHEFYIGMYYYTPASFQAILEEYYPEDPSIDNCEGWLKLFQYHKNGSPVMQQVGDSLHVHIHNTPVSYYFIANHQPFFRSDTLPKPVYERYFDKPKSVNDTFYVGFTRSHMAYNNKDSVWYERRPSFYCMAFDHTCSLGLEQFFNENVAAFRPSGSWDFHDSAMSAYYIFPILTMPDTTVVGGGYVISGDTLISSDTVVVNGDTLVTYDTISVGDVTVGSDTVAYGDTLVVVDTLVFGGDTVIVHDTLLSVMPADLLQRLTGVMPNPAAVTARVVSSVGVSGVDVYSLTGRRVLTLRLPDAPLAANIDVSRMPAGTYLLCIHTPMGAILKKITVAR